MLKSDRIESKNTVQEDGVYDGNNYDLVFPALPDSKTMACKKIEEIDQCASSSRGWTAKDVNSATSAIPVQKEHHCQVMGTQEIRRKEIKQHTGAHIQMQNIQDTSDIINDTGTIDAVEKVVQEICMISDELSKKIFYGIKIPRIFHPFITGGHNEKLKILMKETGVQINVPPPSANKDEIMVSGDREGVQLAIKKMKQVYNKMKNELATFYVTIPKQKHKYLMAHKGNCIQDILLETNVSVELPQQYSDEETVTLRGLYENLNTGIKKLNEKANSITAETIECPRLMQRFLTGKNGYKLRELIENNENVHVEFTDDNKIIIEGPTNMIPKVIESFKEAIFHYVSTELGDIVTKNIVLGNNKVRNVIVYLGNKFIQSIKEDCGSNVSLKLPAVKGDNTIVIKGPENDVDNAITQIQTMVDEVHTSVVDLKLKPEFQKYLIGKNRDNIKRIRDVTNTRIIFPPETDTVKTKNEKITIVGKKENVEKAKLEFEVMITNISHVFEDCVKINEKYHKSFVAKDGKFLHKLEEQCGGIIISFPKPGAGDKIILKGSKANVANAKQRLLDHAKILENTIQLEVNVDPKFHWHFVARHGEIINKIIDDCNGVSITFPKLASNKDVVIIKGNKSNAEEAKHKIEEIVKDLENIIETNMSVPPKHHLHFLAHHAEVINQIIAEYNGVTIEFPQLNSNSSEILINGHKDIVEKVKTKINNIVIDLEQRVTVDAIIPQRMHRILMKNQNLMESMRRDLDVWIKFPERHAEDQCDHVGEEIDDNRAPSVNDIVTIFGKPENCEIAKMKLINNVPKTIDLNIPSEYRRLLIGTKGGTIRKLSKDYNVQIKVPNHKQNADIKITGIQKDINEILLAIKKKIALCDADKEDSRLLTHEIQMTIEPELHSLIIGKKRKTIRDLCNRYDVKVHISKRSKGNNENVLTVRGYQKSVESARDAIQKIIDKLKNDYKEEIYINSRTNLRLIGSTGRHKLRIMDHHQKNINMFCYAFSVILFLIFFLILFIEFK